MVKKVNNDLEAQSSIVQSEYVILITCLSVFVSFLVLRAKL